MKYHNGTALADGECSLANLRGSGQQQNVLWPVPSRRKPAGTGGDVLPVLSAASPATPKGQLANVARGLASGVAWLGLSRGGAHLTRGNQYRHKAMVASAVMSLQRLHTVGLCNNVLNLRARSALPAALCACPCYVTAQLARQAGIP